MLDLIHSIGVACGLGSGDCGTKDGPDFVKQSGVIKELCEFQSILRVSDVPDHDEEAVLHDLLFRLSREVEGVVTQNKPFCVIGGDHSIAMGTWSGARKGLGDLARLGLIWVDAHCDAHTHSTSHTGNIHGMPVAALLGHGKDKFSLLREEVSIQPENIILIGVRDYEPEERELLKSLGVKVYEMDEVYREGFAQVFQESLAIIRKQTDRYGLSIDLDGLDPTHAPGVGTPVKSGIALDDLCSAIRVCHDDSRLLGLEVVEFNPYLDERNSTLRCLQACVEAVFSAEPSEFFSNMGHSGGLLSPRSIDELLIP